MILNFVLHEKKLTRKGCGEGSTLQEKTNTGIYSMIDNRKIWRCRRAPKSPYRKNH
jgi:hypothetical protein